MQLKSRRREKQMKKRGGKLFGMFKTTAKTPLSQTYENGLFYVYNRQLNLLKPDEEAAYNQLKTGLENGSMDGHIQPNELNLYDITINAKRHRFYVKANINKTNFMKKYHIYFGHLMKDFYGKTSQLKQPVMSLILDTFRDFNTKNLISTDITFNVPFSINEHGDLISR
jgi:hypothetical protein